MSQKLTLGFSPCPNDTFMFDALVNGKIDTGSLSFEVVIADVEELNRRALNNELDITKISYHAFAHIRNAYVLLTSGSALGFDCGPLLISKNADQFTTGNLSAKRIGIPGQYTTANLLTSIVFSEIQDKEVLLFSDIEQAVLNGDLDGGVIIHENRFTYQDKGLQKVIDLGEWWQTETNGPIPLGGIAVKRSLSKDIQYELNQLLQKSIEFAFDNPDSSSSFVTEHAQEMEKDVVQQHINLYVNDYSLDISSEGRDAVNLLMQKCQDLKIGQHSNEPVFVD